MFACLHSRRVFGQEVPPDIEKGTALVDLAFTFSPLVEQTTVDTVTLDVSGQDLLFGPTVQSAEAAMDTARNLANAIARRAEDLNLELNVAIGTNPDVVIHAARSFKGITVINNGEELSKLGSQSIKSLDCSLAAIETTRAAEIQETFSLWGIRTFADLSRLPLSGISARLGQEGVRLQKLAQGRSDRQLTLVRPPIGFEQTVELEHPVTELEPLSFILSRLLNQLCANLNEYALATNELRLKLVTEPEPTAIGSNDQVESETPLSTEVDGRRLYRRTITLPVPMRNPKTLLRLLLFDIEAQPPSAPIIAAAISAEPVKPRQSQTGLFIPLAPEPEKLEITLARLAKLVGAKNVGSPEIIDTHRPDAFRMKRFNVVNGKKGKISNRQSTIDNQQCFMGFRIFRPPSRVRVQTLQGRPVRIEGSSGTVRGKIVSASGPWRTSGDWWRADVWARDEWDVSVMNSASKREEVLCRIYRDLTSDEWFMAGIYD